MKSSISLTPNALELLDTLDIDNKNITVSSLYCFSYP